MANRRERTTHQKLPDVTTHGNDITCFITGCKESVSNTLIKRKGKENVLVHACRTHTSKYDRVASGPGAQA